jgi:hypothetical protein
MRIQLRKNLRHSLLYQVIHVDGIDIEVTDIVKQIIKFTSIRIDDAQSVAREMIGIERTHEYTQYDTQGHPQRSKTI